MIEKSHSQKQESRLALFTFQNMDKMFSKTVYVEMAKHLAKRGMNVDFFALRSRNPPQLSHSRVRFIVFPIRFFPIFTHLIYLTISAMILPFYVVIKRPRYIITEPRFGSTFFGLELKLFPRSIRPRAILDIRGTPVEVRNLRSSLGALAFRFSVVPAKRIFHGLSVPTERMKKEICYNFHLNPESVFVWNNGVNFEFFEPRLYNESEIRKVLGLTDKFVVFYHGSFRFRGGVFETVKSIGILKEKIPNLMLFLLGGGHSLPLIENIINENGIQNNVVIHPSVDYKDVPKYIAMCDVGIVPLPDIPDWRYQCPLKLIEYLAMAKPVIVTDIPANREILGTSKSGVYISAADPEKIAEAIEYVYHNREKMKKFGPSGRALVKETYDYDAICEKFEAFLKS